MKHNLLAAAVATSLMLGLCSAGHASALSKLGKAIAYPAQKTIHNAGRNVSHPVNSVTGPINQAGQTTTRSLHKVTPH